MRRWLISNVCMRVCFMRENGFFMYLEEWVGMDGKLSVDECFGVLLS